MLTCIAFDIVVWRRRAAARVEARARPIPIRRTMMTKTRRRRIRMGRSRTANVDAFPQDGWVGKRGGIISKIV